MDRIRMGIIGVVVLVSGLSAIAQECNIRETSDGIALWTDNGLSLNLKRRDGTASAVTIGGKAFNISSKPLLRFEEVVEVPGAHDILNGWGKPSTGLPARTRGAVSDSWIKVPGSADKKPTRIVQLNHKIAAPLILSGLCKYHAVGDEEGWMNRNLAINAACTYFNGDAMPEQSVYFGQYDHGPQLNSKIICPDMPIQRMQVELTANDQKSTAWFKNVSLKPAEYRIASPMNYCSRIDSRVVQRFELKKAALGGEISFQPAKDHIQVRCQFRSLSKVDRAISASIAIPLDAVGGTWYDDARTARKIEAGHIYRNSAWYGAGRDGYFGRYPIAVIKTADGSGLAIGTALDEPRVFQTEYDADKKELRIRYDLGLSPDAGRWANRGSFTCYLFTYDARDGFRGATERFYRICDWAFVKRVQREGLWIAFLTPKSVPGGYEDFHFQFVEAVSNMGWERQQGMYSLKYAEPWIHHHEFPRTSLPAEVTGPIDPMAAVRTAKRLMNSTDPKYPPEWGYRYAGYLSSYITDNWGLPQGYFFRGTRNENMMIVNPNPNVPALQGVDFASGAYDCEANTEASLVWKQWCIDNWTIYRASEKPFLEIDNVQKKSGKQSVRVDPVRSKLYYAHYTRGMSQVVYYSGDQNSPFEFSFWAKGTNVPQSGTTMSWTVEFQSEDDQTDPHKFKMYGLTNEWKLYSFRLAPRLKPAAITVSLESEYQTPDPTVLWVDDIRLTTLVNPGNLLNNGDFESAELMPGDMGGVYLDTMECYANNLNYRRSHWPYAEEPLTFDTARKPALQQQFSHVSYAKRMAEFVRKRDKILFANCVPETCFAAPYLDAMGYEDNWIKGGAYAPRPDGRFNFDRFMCGAKPFCLLNYANFDVEQLEKYVKRCLFYGVFPGIISASPSSGKWYWTNAVLVRRDRPVFAKYMPPLLEITKAGWQPVTLASSDNENVWLERYDDGHTLHLTVFNPTPQTQSARISLDQRCAVKSSKELFEIIGGSNVSLAENDRGLSFDITIASEDVKVFKLTR